MIKHLYTTLIEYTYRLKNLKIKIKFFETKEVFVNYGFFKVHKCFRF